MPRFRGLRLIAGYGTVVSALPYFALKLIWLAGGTLGVADPALMFDRSTVVLNAITAGMDLLGIALALALTHQWGQRIPAWLLLPPTWVATGLLARFVVGVPITVVASALAPEAVPRVAGGPVHAWVYAVVYTEFTGMGIGLTVAFFLYARTRWTGILEAPAGAVRPGATHDLHVVLANTTAIGAIALSVAALASTVGAVARGTIVGTVLNGLDAVLTTSAAAGVLMMVHPFGRSRPLLQPLALAWVGAGSLFGWGLWQTINVVGQTALIRGAGGTAFVNLIGLFRLVVGLVMGVFIVFLLAERSSRVRDESNVIRV